MLKKTSSVSKYDNLILEEDRKKGSIELKILRDFFSLSGGWLFFIGYFIVLLI